MAGLWIGLAVGFVAGAVFGANFYRAVARMESIPDDAHELERP